MQNYSCWIDGITHISLHNFTDYEIKIKQESMNEKQVTRISKFLSLILRHKPEIIDIKLDSCGWIDVKTLIRQMRKHGVEIDMNTLRYVVQNNDKNRFAFSDEFHTKIRASQGHSINVELNYDVVRPPQFLFHGTSEKSIKTIMQYGLLKRSRQYVHLSDNTETALTVGKRHGHPVVYRVSSGEMENDGFEFFFSDNGVWLTDNVPVKYLKRYDTVITNEYDTI